MRTGNQTKSPMGLALGLLTACAMTLIGICSRNEPETVLFRAIIGGIVVAVVARSVINIVSSILIEDDSF